MNQPDLWTGSTGSLKRTSSNKWIIHWSVFLSSTNWLSDPVTTILELTPHWRGKWSVNNDFVPSSYSCVNILEHSPCVSHRKRTTLEAVNNDRTIPLIQTRLQFSLRDTQRAKCADHTQVLGSRSEGDWTRAGGQGGSDWAEKWMQQAGGASGPLSSTKDQQDQLPSGDVSQRHSERHLNERGFHYLHKWPKRDALMKQEP